MSYSHGLDGRWREQTRPAASEVPDAIRGRARELVVENLREIITVRETDCYVVAEGTCLLRTDAGMWLPSAEILVAGDVVAPTSLSPYARSLVRPMAQLRLWRISGLDLDAAIEADEAVAPWLLAGTARRLRRAYHRELNIKRAQVGARVAALIVELDDLSYGAGIVRSWGNCGMSQTEIAHVIGSSRETVNKSVRRLEARGVVRPTREGLLVLDAERLRRSASGTWRYLHGARPVPPGPPRWKTDEVRSNVQPMLGKERVERRAPTMSSHSSGVSA